MADIVASSRPPIPMNSLRFRAPGRVNLVGEHTDYAEGFCMPAALQFGTTVTVTPRHDSRLHAMSLDLEDEAAFDVDELPASPAHHWTDYIVGVARELGAHGVRLHGMDLTISGDVPRNAGLSSSASLEVATAFAMLAAANATLPARELALLCQAAENNFVGAPCGIMDQFISVHGRAGHALQLDCRDLSYDYVPIPDDLRLVIVNSMVKHSVAGREYGERRAQVEEGTRLLADKFPDANIRALRDVSLEQLQQARNSLPEIVYKRCRHVISDSIRVLEGGRMLREGRAEEFGRLLVEAHASYRDDFGASCAECDILVDLAMMQAGCLGSRLTGGGFGGCTVSLVQARFADQFLASVLEHYEARTSIVAQGWIGLASDGAQETNEPKHSHRSNASI
jgi:galactokinase